ncbi:MAG: hypothetical protein ABII76_01590 [Pseudomonadota bacterium]
MAQEQDFQPIDTAPRDGARVRVRRAGCLDHGATGIFINGAWACSELFIEPYAGRIFHQPDQWAPAHPKGEE